MNNNGQSANRFKVAEDMFFGGLNCAQSVVCSFKDILELEESSLIRLTSGFGAGIAKNGHVCGAVSGAVVAIGLKFDTEEYRRQNPDIVYNKVNEFIREFESQNGSTNCNTLLGGVDLRSNQGMTLMKEKLTT